jgi:DNA-binding IclR family transcriptional regulator
VPAPAENGTAAVQSVDRALTILELLAAEGHLGVTEIATLLDVHKSTASRLLATLETHGLAEQLPDRGRYRLGVGVLRLAGATRSRMDLVQESRPVAAALASAVGETVNVVILSGRETLYLDQVSGTSALQIHNWVGKRNPIHATANGRVLLAHVSEAECDAILAALSDGDGELARVTERTLVSRAAVTADLARIRERGYAVVRDELEVGLTAVAAPVRDAGGEVVASLSVSGPTFRIEDRLEPIAQQVRQAARAVSQRMGWSG